MKNKKTLVLLLMIILSLALCACVITPVEQVTEILVTRESVKEKYIVGDVLDVSKVAVSAKYNTGVIKPVDFKAEMLTGFTTERPGKYTCKFTFSGLNATLDYEVAEVFYDADSGVSYEKVIADSGGVGAALMKAAGKSVQLVLNGELTADDVLALGTLNTFKYMDLSLVSFPANIFPSNVFNGSETLNYVVLPDSVVTIADGALNNLSALKCVKIGQKTKTITANPMVNCAALENIKVNELNEYFCTISGVLYNMDGTSLIAYPANRAGEKFIPLSTLTKIGVYAFSNNKNIKTLSVGDKISVLDNHSFDGAAITALELTETVTQIGEYAFNGCAALTTVNMKNNVNSIKDGAFANCTSLNAVNLSSGVLNLPKYLFDGCTSLKRIPISNVVRVILPETFAGASALEFLEVSEANRMYSHIDGVLYSYDKNTLCYYPEGKINETASYSVYNGAISIKEGAFNNTKLQSIGIPATLTAIEINAFRNNSELLGFTVDDKNTSFKADDGILTNRSATRLVKFPDNKVKTGNSYTIPGTIGSVDEYAFSGNLKLETIVIGSQMREISPYVFANMKALRTIKAHANFSRFMNNAFYGSNTLDRIELETLKVIFEKDALNGFDGEINVIAKPHQNGVDFYGYYDSDSIDAASLLNCVLVPSAPKTLTTSMVAIDKMTLFTRYGDYEVGMDVTLKDGVSEIVGFYATAKSSTNEAKVFMDTIISRYCIKIVTLDGKTTTTDLTIKDFKDYDGKDDFVLKNTDIANPEYIINIQRDNKFTIFNKEIKVRLKDREVFSITYSVSEKDGGGSTFSYKTLNSEIYDSTTKVTIAATEGFHDVEYVTASAGTKMLFHRFSYTVGENKSDYYDPSLVDNNIDTNIVAKVTGDAIHFENIVCDIEVQIRFLPELDVSIAKGQSISEHKQIGGNIYYDGAIIRGDEPIIKNTKHGMGLSSIMAEPFAMFPEEYGENVDKVFGYRFNTWKFTDESGNVLSPIKDADGTYTITIGEGATLQTVRFSLTRDIQNKITVTSTIDVVSAEFNFNVMAEFIPYYAVTYAAEEGGAIREVIDNAEGAESTEIIQYITHGADANEIRITRMKNYNFLGWNIPSVGDPIASNARKDKNITAPATYIARFQSLLPITYENIMTVADFTKMRENPSGNFILKNDIDFGGINWIPIGTKSEPFRGMFDGCGFTLSNFIVKDQALGGFFGYFTGDARNLVMSNVTIDCSLKQEIFAGVIAGYMQNGSVTNSIVKDSKINVANAGKASVGGIVGMVHEGIVANCVAQISDFLVGGEQYVFVGGLVGQIDLGEIFNNYTVVRPYFARSVGDMAFAGGIVGYSGTSANSIRYNYYDGDEVAAMAEKSGYSKPTRAIGSGTHPLNSAKATAELKNGNLPSSSWNENVWIVETGNYPTIDFDIGIIEISTVADLMKIFSYPTGKFRLLNDIHLTNNWVPISYFAGTFDGDERTIFNVTVIDTNSVSYINSGFFAKLGSGAIVNNVGFKDTYIESRAANANVGGIAGAQSGGLIFGTYITGTIAIFNSTNTNGGGLVGMMTRDAKIHNSYCVMDISSENGETGVLGGAIGLISSETNTQVNIQFSYSMSTVYVRGDKATYNLGGFIGNNASKKSIIKNNFYVTTTMNAIDETYKRPESLMTGNLVGDNTGDIFDNMGLGFVDLPSASETPVAPFDKWDRGIWKFSERENLNPYLYFETDIFNPEGGAGTSESPYLIDTYEELKWLKVYNNLSFKMTKNIDLTGKDWSPFMFVGTLDGDGYSIIGLNFKQSKKGGAGLFSELGGNNINNNGGFVKNLNLINIDFNINDASEDLKIGAIAMKAKASARIENCSVTGKININIPRGAIVGGLVGYAAGKSNDSSAVKYKYNTTFVNMTLKSTTEVVANGADFTKPGDDVTLTQGRIIAGGLFGIAENIAMSYENTYGAISVSAMKSEIGGFIGRTFGRNGVGVTAPGINIQLSSANNKIDVIGRLNSNSMAGGMVGRHYSGSLIIKKSTVRNGSIISIKDLVRPTKDTINKTIITFDIGGILGRLGTTLMSAGTAISTNTIFNNNLYDGEVVVPYDEKIDANKENPNSIVHAGMAGIIVGTSVNAPGNSFDNHLAYKMTTKTGSLEITQAFGSIPGQLGDNLVRRDRITQPITFVELNIGNVDITPKNLIFADPNAYKYSNGQSISGRYPFLTKYPPSFSTVLITPYRTVNVGENFALEKATFLQNSGGSSLIEETDQKPMLYRSSVDTSVPGIYVVSYRYSEPGVSIYYYAHSIIEVK